ncbi:hypothetical protein SAMN04489806_2276 [Paramicrobacterium humi]|uniref:Copper(I)-binding protein n=1 Tax=Paramicrobacterium humi TaxID=640635 RepID=A0A1H4NQV4_9MICO|nr:hypothetical protein [Microbacterium humi]SEB97643.1 hypothetical protein SAMN04489806_2276 [Microbacterium humi]
MRSRPIALVVLAAAVALGSSGCGLLAPQSTTIHYDASDGVGGTVGDVDVRNAMIIANEDGTAGNLVVTLVNTGDSSHSVEIGWGESASASTSVVVDAGASTTFGVPADQNQGEPSENITVSPLPAKPGAITDVFFQYGTETGVTLTVPIYNGDLAEYSTLVPTPAE